MPFTGDQHPIQALAAGAGDPPRIPAAVSTASKAAVNFGVPVPGEVDTAGVMLDDDR